jgi:hypothetical protein
MTSGSEQQALRQEKRDVAERLSASKVGVGLGNPVLPWGSEDVEIDCVFEGNSLVSGTFGGMQSTSPARTMISSSFSPNFKAPSKM